MTDVGLSGSLDAVAAAGTPVIPIPTPAAAPVPTPAATSIPAPAPAPIPSERIAADQSADQSVHESAERAVRPSTPPRPWTHVAQTAAALAAGMGVGRFVFTPILPAMHAQAGLSAASGANLATANYVGYLIGAVAGIVRPSLIRSRSVLRISLAVLIVSLAAMPVTHTVTAWLVLRLAAGIASALVFVVAVSSLTSHLRGHPAHLTGWAFGGVGGGIALSGLLILVIRAFAGWQADWWAAAGLAALLSVVAWNLRPEAAATAAEPRPERISTHRWFTALFVSYTFEGIGYIVAGTFLVAAIEQGSPAWVGSGAWVLVGLAAVPSSAVWAALARHRSRPALLVTALLIQAVGIALPALVGGVAPAMTSAILFGATFIGVSTLALGTGTHLRFPRSVALLTAGYSVGQILGPLVVTPLLQHGYRQALLSAAGFVLVSAGAAAVLGVGFPRAVSTAQRETRGLSVH